MWIFIFWKIGSGVFFMIIRRFALNFLCVNFYKKYRMNEKLHSFMMVFAMQSYVELLISSLITIQLTSKIDIISTNFNDLLLYCMSLCFGFYVFLLPGFIQNRLKTKFMFIDAENSPNTTMEYRSLL